MRLDCCKPRIRVDGATAENECWKVEIITLFKNFHFYGLSGPIRHGQGTAVEARHWTEHEQLHHLKIENTIRLYNGNIGKKNT